MSDPEQDDAFEEIEHAADWSFRVRGRDLAELFRNAAKTIATLEHGKQTTPPTITRTLQVEGGDRESLLVNWLNELLYIEETTKTTYSNFEILEIKDTRLRTRLSGTPAHDHRRRIKAVTFHNLEVKTTANGLEATLVIDV